MISNMILESPTMLERTVKSYKQETKELKWNHKSQYLTNDYIYFKKYYSKIILKVFIQR